MVVVSQRLMLLVLVVAGAVLCVSAAAVRPTAWEGFSGSMGRTLLQDALSNSNGCLDTIPKCEQGACATRNVMGVARWVCLRCLANYDPVVTADGQDNIIQCVCPKGTYEATANATSCTRCSQNSWCAGGDRVENPASRGAVVQCGSGLITRNTGARSAADCVAPAGFAMASAAAATPCARSEYSPQYNRLQKCIRCQGGLEEPIASTLTDGQRSSKRAVCKVPPGKYMSQGLVRICPQGFYRENYESFDAPVAQICVACNPAITTAGAGAKLAAECNRVMPGYGVDSILNVTGPQSIPALPQDASGLPAASVCGFGFYSTGGYCAQCPAGTVTRVLGAESIEECVVPPGYYLPAAGMTSCGNGTYREGWLMYSDPKATACTACGDNIWSEARDLDESPLVSNGTLTRATSTSCYIDVGQGMIAQGQNTFLGLTCPVNTYGVAGRVYGLLLASCKPCARNLITNNVTGASSSEACINPAGYGYASEGASRCAPGFYAAKGSRKACMRCPPGRTTEDNPELQQWLSHCDVAPGYGVTGGALPANGDIFSGSLDGLSEQQILDLTVLQCPTGYYGLGDVIASTCVKCPDSSTTKEPGATSLADCNVCLPGHGRANSTAPCTLCEYGFWQPGGLSECQPCPDTIFYPPVDGLGAILTSKGVTFSKGATGLEWCVPTQSQLSPEAGQAYFSAAFINSPSIISLFVSTAASLQYCVEQCQPDQCCLAQYDVDAGSCTTAMLAPAGATEVGPQIFYKLPPSGLSAASSIPAGPGSNLTKAMSAKGLQQKVPRIQAGTKQTVTFNRQQAGSVAAKAVKRSARAKTLASGLYARCVLPPQEVADWQQLGTALGPDARTFVKGPAVWLNVTDVAVCQELCDNSNVCWGGFYQDGRCLFRGGIDALRTRSFFALPAPDSAPGLVVPSANANYYTLSGNNVSYANISDPARLTLFTAAVVQAVQQVAPAMVLGADLWVQVPPTGAPGVEVGFYLDDGMSGALQADLTPLFSGNASTTALVARSLVELSVAAGGDSLLLSGLSMVSSDGIQTALETPILVDGCALVPQYCSANSVGTCSVNRCSCQAGWSGYRCTQAASAGH